MLLRPRLARSRPAVLLGLVALWGCADEPPPGPVGPRLPTLACAEPRGLAAADAARWRPPPQPDERLGTRFRVTVDVTHPDLGSAQREPQVAPLSVETLEGSLRLEGGVKRFVLHPERLFLELYPITDQPVGLAHATATVRPLEGAAAFYDLNVDPWAEGSAPTEATLPIGGIAPEGVSRVKLGFDVAPGATELTFELEVEGDATTLAATSAAPLAVTPDGAEVWAPYPDGDRLAILDAGSERRVATLPMIGRPTSVAITPDGALVLVACQTCNQLQVVERATREVVQVLGEDQGIGRDPRHVVLSPDGTRAYVSAYVGDTVTALERVGDRFRVRETIAVGRRPVGLSVSPDGATVYVAHWMPRGPIRDNEAWVSVIDTERFEVTEAVLRDDGNVEEADCLRRVAVFEGYTGEELTFEASPTQLAGVFLHPSGHVGWVPALRVAGFPILEGDPAALGFEFLSVGANSPAMFFPLDTRQADDAGFRRVSSSIDIEDRNEDFLRCYPTIDDAEAVRVRPGPSDDERLYAGVTIPSQSTFLNETGVSRFVGYTRGGRRVLVLSYIADQLAVMDGATHGPTSLDHLLLSGSNPVGLAVSPSGDRAYVAYENSPFVSVLDLSAYAGERLPEPSTVPYRLDDITSPGQGAAIVTFRLLVRSVGGVPERPAVIETGQIPLVDEDPMDPVLRRGAVLFTSSSPEKYPQLSGGRQAACASCHPNGGVDGTCWSTMEGERRTMGLWGGVAGRGWLHASATHESITDFATTIVTERLGGSGLSPDDQHALSRYAAEGIAEVQRPATDPARVAEGEALFDRHCLSCHSGSDGGSGNASAAHPYGGAEGEPGLYDVGTGTEWASVTLGEPYLALFPPVARRVLGALRGDRNLGPGDMVQETLGFSARPDRPRGMLKAPALTNGYENVLFFHDGRFTSLADVVDYFDATLALDLDDRERAALVEYLRSL